MCSCKTQCSTTCNCHAGIAFHRVCCNAAMLQCCNAVGDVEGPPFFKIYIHTQWSYVLTKIARGMDRVADWSGRVCTAIFSTVTQWWLLGDLHCNIVDCVGPVNSQLPLKRFQTLSACLDHFLLQWVMTWMATWQWAASYPTHRVSSNQACWIICLASTSIRLWSVLSFLQELHLHHSAVHEGVRMRATACEHLQSIAHTT